MTDEFAINILEQYREKPTLINEIKTVEEAVWLAEALDMAIKALKQTDVLDKIRAEIFKNRNWHMSHRQEDVAMIIDLEALAVIDKYRAESEGE